MATPRQQEPHAPVRLIASLRGSDLYLSYCAACHGRDGRGHGPTVAALKSPVPDLTTIWRRHGGKFPRERIRATIGGEDRPAAHGSSEMPLWGTIFSQIENDTDYGSVRLENVLLYLESIQIK
jgi:mono/diheme cytochrome c family protein